MRRLDRSSQPSASVSNPKHLLASAEAAAQQLAKCRHHSSSAHTPLVSQQRRRIRIAATAQGPDQLSCTQLKSASRRALLVGVGLTLSAGAHPAVAAPPLGATTTSSSDAAAPKPDSPQQSQQPPQGTDESGVATGPTGEAERDDSPSSELLQGEEDSSSSSSSSSDDSDSSSSSEDEEPGELFASSDDNNAAGGGDSSSNNTSSSSDSSPSAGSSQSTSTTSSSSDSSCGGGAGNSSSSDGSNGSGSGSGGSGGGSSGGGGGGGASTGSSKAGARTAMGSNLSVPSYIQILQDSRRSSWPLLASKIREGDWIELSQLLVQPPFDAVRQACFYIPWALLQSDDFDAAVAARKAYVDYIDHVHALAAIALKAADGVPGADVQVQQSFTLMNASLEAFLAAVPFKYQRYRV